MSTIKTGHESLIFKSRFRACCALILLLFFFAFDCKADLAVYDAYKLQDVVVQNTDKPFISDAAPFLLAVWESPKKCLPSPPELMAFTMPDFDERSRELARLWLRQGPYDDDEMLECRLDEANDQVGRLMDAMLLRLQLHDVARKKISRAAVRVQSSLEKRNTRASNILFDSRSLQHDGLRNRGIGLYAKDALNNLRNVADHGDIVLLVDPVQSDLPADVQREHRCVSSVDESDASFFRALVQPSPRTGSPEPFIALLRRKDAIKIAVVYDFIPMRYVDVYLPNVIQRAEYAVELDALLLYYNRYISISRATKAELKELIASKLSKSSEGNRRGNDLQSLRGKVEFQVALPSSITDMSMKKAPLPQNMRDGSIVIMTGMEHRKNTIAALAAVHLSHVPQPRTTRIIGLAGFDHLVKQWCAMLGVPFDQVQVMGHVDDHEKRQTIRKASLVVIPSFDEGLSLPVIEALAEGTPVVASEIETHEELMGFSDYLASPKNVSDLAQAISKHYNQMDTVRKQRQHYLEQNYGSMDKAISASLSDKSFRGRYYSSPVSKYSKDGTAASSPLKARRRLNVGIATPWQPQQSGIADFSRAVVPDLARRAQVTVYVTSSASSQVPADSRFRIKPASHLIKVARNAHAHDVLIIVLGNSLFHLPFLRLLHRHDCQKR